MKLVNTDYLPGEDFTFLGLVRGSCIVSHKEGANKETASKLCGQMLAEARATACKRMITEAEALGADTIVNVRFLVNRITENAAEIFVYGTAAQKSNS